MGWDFGTGETKSDRIRDLTKTWTRGTRTTTTLRHCVKGNVLWYVAEVTDTATTPPTVERWIGVSLLGAMKGVGWGSKDMDESMGPCEVNCPLEYLAMVPEPTGPYAKGWRARVRAYHARVGRKLAIGETVKLVEGCKPAEVVIESLKPLRGRATNGIVYRIPRRHLAAVEG